MAAQAADELKSMRLGQFTGTALPISIATTPAKPTLSAGGVAGAQFDAFAKDQVAQLAMAQHAYQDAMGPQQKYKLVEQQLDLLLKEKLIDQNAYNAAWAQAIDLRSRSAKKGLEGAVDEFNPNGGKMQQLRQRMDTLRAMQSKGVDLGGDKLNAGDLAAIDEEMQAITEEEDKILIKTGGIATGFKAWADGLQRVKSEGEFTFEMLSQATRGFEEHAAKTWIDILEIQRKAGETTRQEHRRLLIELRTLWAGYFNDLAKMAMTHGIEKLLASAGGM